MQDERRSQPGSWDGVHASPMRIVTRPRSMASFPRSWET